MFNKILLLIMLTCGLAVAQDTTYLDGTGCGGCDSIVYTAPSVTDTSSIPEQECAVKDGKAHGYCKGYYSDLVRVVHWETPYVSGVAHGVERVYYESGRLALESPYKNGRKNGIEKQYLESGPLDAEVPYKDGELLGVVKWYWESGVLRAEIPSKDGKCTGSSKYYYKSGILESVHPHVNGKYHGTSKWFHPSGKLAGTATYKHGELVGYKTCTDGRRGNESLDCLRLADH